ncbi:Large ribosomal RNA subunit accumulation protein YCED-like 2, chloroplastic [Vitis vinifera]|uniref:Large ribosomal RNA subunit accumulation protein YCED-like 2, chloroplastic n=1 Tax=Vitis vinifera TaxID=29760 RepID=A0A438JB29_VITVI|nr:Large ribosomal RNA subunit accumulation protein YCED-like 2, chloroplastic [Vitis vinifera]
MARAKAGDLISLRNINPLHTTYQAAPTAKPPSSFLNIRASSKKANGFSLIAKKSSRSPKRLITISTSDGRWHGKWNSDYVFSFRELQLEDLVEEDEEKDAEVSISLCIHKVIIFPVPHLFIHVHHASFGFSVDGRIITSFTRKCSNCSSPYCKEVIYVKPGCEANLDSLIQDTIRLTTSVKDTCSETCEKSEPTLQYIGAKNAASIDMRWSRLLELRNANL